MCKCVIGTYTSYKLPLNEEKSTSKEKKSERAMMISSSLFMEYIICCMLDKTPSGKQSILDNMRWMIYGSSDVDARGGGRWLPGLDVHPLRLLYSSMARSLSLSWEASCAFLNACTQAKQLPHNKCIAWSIVER